VEVAELLEHEREELLDVTPPARAVPPVGGLVHRLVVVGVEVGELGMAEPRCYGELGEGAG